MIICTRITAPGRFMRAWSHMSRCFFRRMHGYDRARNDLEGRIQDMAKPTKLNPAFEAAVRRMLAPHPQPKPTAKTKEKAKKSARK
jgi:hypothetical protein